jgi:iron complex outermembrane receptor protein
LHPTTGCLLAEIIPVEPDPDNAGEGNGLRIAFWQPVFRGLKIQQRNMKKQLLLLIFLLPVISQAQVSLSGFIRDKESRKPIPLVQLGLEGSTFYALSKEDGSFELKGMKEGFYHLKAGYLGYFPYRIALQLKGDRQLDILLEPRDILSEEVIVKATRSGAEDPGTRSLVKKEDLEKLNLGQDLPILLQQETSVLATSDAGAGVGYTGISIRGSDATRINVNLNGIPLNDAESHGLFWVNMPDFASSVSSIQIQRGVGTSSNGTASFGASLNIQTNTLKANPWAETSHSFGSFNTMKNNLQLGTGLIDGRWSAEARISRIASDGFIDRGNSDLKSQYFTGGYYGKKSIIKFVLLDGNEKTYQAWNGIPEAKLRGNASDIAAWFDRNRYFPPYMFVQDSLNAQQADPRTFNIFRYRNQTDNYRQTHYQLFFSHEFSENWNLNTALHYTRGAGYYEEYRQNDDLDRYKLSPRISGTDTIRNSDLIRQRWLDNHFFGGTWSLQYRKDKLDVMLGGAANSYIGDHFGKVLWTKEGVTADNDYQYYFNDARKNELNQYLKAGYRIHPKLRLFADVQLRRISYRFAGFDRNLNVTNQQVNLSFLNPKAGLTFRPDSLQEIWLLYGKSQREPVRDDFTNSTPDSRPKPEVLHNIELGWRFENRKLRTSANFYHMEYINQLILTGKINDVGAYVRSNVESSYRSGLEMEAVWLLHRKFQLLGNMTISRNRIRHYDYFTDNYDTGVQDKVHYKDTPISFSPSLIASAGFQYSPVRNLEIGLQAKFAGRQFMDNTGTASRSLDPYQFVNFTGSWQLPLPFLQTLRLNVLVNNLFNHQYETNGYTFGYVYGGARTTENFYYPQAGRNYLIGFTLGY